MCKKRGSAKEFQKIGEKGNKVRQLLLGCKGKYLGHKIGKQAFPLQDKD